MDGFHRNTDRMHMTDEEDNISLPYENHSHGLSNGDLIDKTGGYDGHCNIVENDGLVEGSIISQHDNLSDSCGAVLEDHGPGDCDQLTLSFQGQVYVFDSVSPEKVQAVLLLLGGREISPSSPYSTPVAHSNKNSCDTPRLNIPQRLASLIRFREKRKELNFEKKIRYSVRKEVALRMQRKKGQFTSSKPISTSESQSAMITWGANDGCGSDNGSEHQEAICRHCGTNEKSTPMMRRGPEGPRTLCNACGLMWANKGTLRDLSKAAVQHVGSNPLFGNG